MPRDMTLRTLRWIAEHPDSTPAAHLRHFTVTLLPEEARAILANDAELRRLAKRCEELEGATQTLLGAFDTPVARRRIDGEFAQQARAIGRAALQNDTPERSEG